jgi:hypothetical protein
LARKSGTLFRKPSGGERAWFLHKEESEPRTKGIFRLGKITGLDKQFA